MLRDDGKEFRLAASVSPEVIKTTLQLALQRFGSELSVNGTEEFYKQVVDVAANNNMKLSFTSPVLEEHRKALIQELHGPKPTITKEQAAERYINERNEKLKQGIEDILPHRRYNEDKDGNKHIFAGLRQVEGKTLMLLKTPTEMLLLPIEDEKTIRRTQDLKIGEEVEVHDLGVRLSRGRRM